MTDDNDTRALRPAWGKTERETGGIHPLAHHSMDAAAVFLRMTQLPVIRNRLETAAGRPLTAADCARLAALVFLHDIGKLHPGFQAKGWPPGLWNEPKAGHMQKGWEFLQLACSRTEHPFHKTMRRIAGWGEEAVAYLLAAILAHHGRPVEQAGDPTLREWDTPPLQHYDWRAETRVMDSALRRWFDEAFEPNAQPLPDRPAFHHLVCGLVALADWIGSDTQFFEFAAPFDPDYDAAAHRRAKRALQRIGFDIGALAGIPAPDFKQWTDFTPNPAQAAVGSAGTDSQLLILEAETGSGKTEAALWRFTQLLAAGEVSSLYFAVPTRAAARQLHGRVNEALRRTFGGQAPEAVLAVPGMVRAGEFAGRRLPDWRVLWEDREGPIPARWAAEHATRFLAAPAAVGTVDQAMLAGLQAKHAHLRGSALSRALLVIDEVHASDSYMTAILQRLLRGHLAAGGYAMLMSATLGSRARVLWTGEAQPDIEAADAAPYPAVWVKGENAPRAAAGAGRPKTVHLETAPTMAPAEAARRAVAAAQRGARVLVIRNTVGMAAATWRAAREAGGESLLLQAAGGPALHHGRFAVEDRELLDRAAEAALAPRQRKPGGRIVIGTQTLEQSLDIDADLLLADLCPMDVLLQRIGRLHRHNLQRPAGFETARAAVLLPEDGLDRLAAPKFENGLGAWEENNEFNGIYRDLAGLELTRRLLAERPVWRIPQMNRALVESATHPDRIAALIVEKGEQWEDYDRQFGGSEAAARMLAQLNVLDREEPFDDELRFPSSDEKIMTRLGEEGAVLKLDPPPQGPFGQRITRIALPARWSRGIAENPEVAVEPDGDGLILSVGKCTFSYTREGLNPLRP